MTQGGEVASREIHALETAGSTPAPATNSGPKHVTPVHALAGEQTVEIVWITVHGKILSRQYVAYPGVREYTHVADDSMLVERDKYSPSAENPTMK